MAWPLHLATELKWLAVLALLGWLVLQLHASHQFYRARPPGPEDVPRRGDGYSKLRRVGHALQIQRFSLVVVGLLAVMAIGPPLNGTLEQMPDVQRAWFNTGSFLGVPQLAFAALAQVLLALMLWSLGQMRARRAVVKFTDADDPRHRPATGAWAVAAAVVAVAAAAAWLTGAARVSACRVAACCVILLLVAGVSAAIGKWWPGLAEPDRPARPASPRDAAEILRLAGITGDTLAVTVIAVTPLGIVRSFTAPALVSTGLSGQLAVAAGLAGAATLPLCCWLLCCGRPGQAVAAAAAAATAAEQPGPAAPAELPSVPRPAGGPESRAERANRNRALAGTPRVLWVTGILFALADAWLIGDPLPATHLLGVLATAVIAIGSLGVLLGVLAFLVQPGSPSRCSARSGSTSPRS